jgi:hypothetical protein
MDGNAPRVNIITQSEFKKNKSKYINDYIAVLGRPYEVTKFYQRDLKGYNDEFAYGKEEALADPEWTGIGVVNPNAGDMSVHFGKGIAINSNAVNPFLSEYDNYYHFSTEQKLATMLLHGLAHNVAAWHVNGTFFSEQMTRQFDNRNNVNFPAPGPDNTLTPETANNGVNRGYKHIWQTFQPKVLTKELLNGFYHNFYRPPGF